MALFILTNGWTDEIAVVRADCVSCARRYMVENFATWDDKEKISVEVLPVEGKTGLVMRSGI